MARRRSRRNRRPRDVSSNYSQNVSLVRQPNSPFPQSLTVKETYSYVGALVATSGIYINQVFRMNSTWDPDKTGTGTQPYGRDQLAAIYQKYRVLNCAWNIEAISTDQGAGTTALVGVGPSPADNLTLVQDIAALPWGKAHQIAIGSQSRIFRGSLPLNQFLGQTQPVFRGDDSNEALVGTNPTALAYLVVGVQNTQGQTVTINIMAMITYTVNYFMPAQMGPS